MLQVTVLVESSSSHIRLCNAGAESANLSDREYGVIVTTYTGRAGPNTCALIAKAD